MEMKVLARGRGERRWSGAVRWALGLGVAALSCWLLVRELEWQAVVAALTETDYRWVVAGGLMIVGTFYTRTRRWQALLWQARVSLRAAMTALLVGQVVNMALPMRSGDVVRAMWIGPEEETGAAEALGSVAVEKVWDLLALIASAAALLVWIPLPAWFARSTWGTGLALAVGIGLMWAGLHWQETLFDWAGRVLALLPAGWDEALLPRLRRLTRGLGSIRRADASAGALLWTGLTWLLGATANWAVLAAFGIPSAVAALFLLAALMAGGTVPTPGKFGIFEGIVVASLSVFGVGADEALAVGLVLHVVVMGPPLVAAALLAFLAKRHSGREDG